LEPEHPLPPGLAAAAAAGEVLILGFGREGLSTYRFLRRAFPQASLTVADMGDLDGLEDDAVQAIESDERLTFVHGPGYAEPAREFSFVFRSPGIRPDLSELAAAEVAGARLTSNSELFLELCPGRVVGVTGTKGKSTTTAVIHSVLRAGGLDARLIGNIGHPPLSSLGGATGETVFAMELSSFQLATFRRSPEIAVIQSVVPEHLDYHGGFERYVDAKANIARHQGPEGRVIHHAGPVSTRIASASPGRSFAFGLDPEPGLECHVRDGWIVDGSREVLPVGDVPLLGRFNLVNVLPAVVVGRLFGIPSETVAEAIRRFRPLEHRLEPVAEVDGVEFFDDSLATVPEAAQAALGAFPGRPVVLIAGGHDRGQDFAPLAAAIRAADVRALVLFPATGRRLLDAVRSAAGQGEAPSAAFVETMEDAVDAAIEASTPGGIVLLSPGSASFGVFRDYRDRGDRFKAEVMRRVSATRPDLE
jgi:UDP-N-acetylmuramoylalanine--D-glutamate ligase